MNTTAFVIHSDTGRPIVECATVTEAFSARDRLEVVERDLFHVVLASDLLVEGPVNEKVVA